MKKTLELLKLLLQGSDSTSFEETVIGTVKEDL